MTAFLQQYSGDFAVVARYAGDHAGIDLRKFVAEQLAALVRGAVCFPDIAAALDGFAAVVELVTWLGLAVAQTRPYQRIALTRLGIDQSGNISQLPSTATQPIVFKANDIWQVVEFVSNAQVFQERLDLGQRDRIDGRLLARAWLYAQAGASGVQVGKVEHIARVDLVWVVDLWIGLPDFRPQPGFIQEPCGDVPQRVAFEHDVAIWVRGSRVNGEGIGNYGQQRCGHDRA
jgi:hypothetical protein